MLINRFTIFHDYQIIYKINIKCIVNLWNMLYTKKCSEGEDI